jgi:hypothetical protein
MKTLFKNKKKYSKKEQTIIELFGLSNAGKTTFLKELSDQGKKVFFVEKGNNMKKSFLLMKYFIKHPYTSFYLFCKLNTNWIIMKHLNPTKYFKIFLMRNSYLSAVLAKFENLKSEKGELFVDEFLLEALFMIFQNKASEKTIFKTMKKLIYSDEILMVEVDKKIRHERLKKRTPGDNIDIKYALKWVENAEHNNEIFKKFLSNWFIKSEDKYW